jgi:hypothetical protein
MNNIRKIFENYGVENIDLDDYTNFVKDISFQKDIHCLDLIQEEHKFLKNHSEKIRFRIENEGENISYIIESNKHTEVYNKLSDIKNKKVIYLFIILKKYLNTYVLNTGDFVVPKKTNLRHYNISNGLSKNEEWLQIEGVPCKVISITEDMVELNSFTSSSDRTFNVSKTDLYNTFYKCEVDDNYILDLYKYPDNKIYKKEFDIKDDVKKLENQIKKFLNITDDDILKTIIKDKLLQIISSQGSDHCINISTYKKYINNELNLSNNKRIGDPVFNRNKRWCPPLRDMSYEEYEKTNSFPAPFGIRDKDFCMPSGLLDSLKELIVQIFNFKNIKLIDKVSDLFTIERREDHKCRWCGVVIDAKLYSSVYKSQKNYIEICHRDPNGRFTKDNIYWGHGECNRRQGGYSEEDIIKDAMTLILNNPEYKKYISNF